MVQKCKSDFAPAEFPMIFNNMVCLNLDQNEPTVYLRDEFMKKTSDWKHSEHSCGLSGTAGHPAGRHIRDLQQIH